MLVLTSRGAQLRRIAADADDASGFFPAMYAQVTAAVEQRCVEGRFDDPDRMVRFVDRFAGYYVDALTAHRTGGPVPACWRASWDVAGDGRLLVVQHLLLGMNAHINHDLPQAVVAVADAGGDLGSVRADFEAINDVLADSYDDTVKRLDRVARWTSEAASLGGGRLFRFSLTTARRQAWAAAERLYPLDDDGRASYIAELDRLVAVLALLVTRPHPPVSWLLPLARRLEQRDCRRVTAALLGESAPSR